MEAFASIVLRVIATFVYAGFTAVTEKLDEIIERLTPPRHVHDGEPSVGQRAALAVRPGTGAWTWRGGVSRSMNSSSFSVTAVKPA